MKNNFFDFFYSIWIAINSKIYIMLVFDQVKVSTSDQVKVSQVS